MDFNGRFERPDLIQNDQVFVDWLRLYVIGTEVTQAVQFFDADQHLTDPADRQADNAVRLVSGKPAWVRVHLGSRFGTSGVTGTLELQRRRFGFLYTPVATFSPHSSSVTSLPASSTTTYAARRGDIGQTLNFVIPANEMIGTLRLVVRASSGPVSVHSTVDVAVTLRQTLRLAGVMVSYNGPSSMAAGSPNLTLAAPVLADLQAMSGLALSLFPVRSTASFRVAGSLTQTVPLQSATFPTSGCGTAWDALHARVATVRTADGNQPGWIYYGLLPSGTPMGPVGGCGGGGVAVGPINRPGTLAHEAGHAAGLPHAPSGGAPNPDPNYPAYEPYDPANTPMGSTGEYGLDVNNGNVKVPSSFRDIMGYAGPQWISPYNHGRLTNNAVLNPATVGIDHLWWPDFVKYEVRRPPFIPEPDPPFRDLEVPVFPPSQLLDLVSVIVQVDEGKIVGQVKVARTQAFPELPAAGSTPFTVNLRDADGQVLASGELVRLTTAACGGCGGADDGPPPSRYVAQTFLPDVAPGASLDITTDGERVWSRQAPADPPRVELGEPKVAKAGSVTLGWEASDGADEFWLRWSRDGKQAWQSIETDVTGRRLRLDAGRLPAGEGFLQVVAHDGFSSTASRPVRVEVPETAPDVAILHPQDGYTYPAGQELRLWASVTTPLSDADAAEAVWSVDGDEVGRGTDAWAPLPDGRHTVTVRIGRAEASVEVTAVTPGQVD